MIRDIELTEFELNCGGRLGVMRWLEALRKGCQDQYGAEGEDGLLIHFFGACGEMAFAKAMGVYFLPTLNVFKVPDVGLFYVRTAMDHRHRLIIRPKDPQGTYALMTVDVETWPFRFRLRGAYERCKVRDEWLENPRKKSPAWFVPQSELAPLVLPVAPPLAPVSLPRVNRLNGGLQ